MNKEAILENLRAIWSALLQGDLQENQVANLLFIGIKALEEYWFNLSFKKARPQYSSQDPVENFLSNIADL